MQQQKFRTVEEYLSSLPESPRIALEELLKTIRKAAPEAEEVISYNMPAFRFHGMLVYCAAFKNHIGFYPGNSTLIRVFNEELKDFETSKGTIRFPMGKPLPLGLVRKIVAYRVKENLAKVKIKGKGKI